MAHLAAAERPTRNGVRNGRTDRAISAHMRPVNRRKDVLVGEFVPACSALTTRPITPSPGTNSSRAERASHRMTNVEAPFLFHLSSNRCATTLSPER